MADVLLTPPRSWADEVRALPLDRLALSYDPDHLDVPVGRSIADIKRDLQPGMWLVRDRRARDEVYRVGGVEFELRIRPRDGRDTKRRMAVVRNVDPARSVPPKAHRLRVQDVKFAPVWDEAECDLREIEQRVRERERQFGPKSRGHGYPDQAELGSHGRLQRAVLAEYGELETLIGILEQRPEELEDTTVGTVVELGYRPRRPTIVIAPHNHDPDGFRNKRVQLVAPDGHSFNTRVTGVRRGRLEIAEPQDWSALPGTEVSVSVVRPFGMRQNAEALRTFREGRIEGSWEDLARLLCRPKDLRPPQTPQPLVFYCDDDPDPSVPVLSKEQRKAVTCAVATPHAFLVQGPPGTGKSEVICEIIRQLAGRGERVLLLAPAHVAVDEVLHRIGRKPGIRPLRITWSEERVGERLREFLPGNVGTEATDRILRPTYSGQAARWERELHALKERLAAINDLRDTDHQHTAVVEALRGAAQTASDARDRLRSRQTAADGEISGLEDDLARAEYFLTEASTALGNSTKAEASVQSQLSPGLETTRDAARELARAGELLTLAEHAERNAGEDLQAWQRGYQARLEHATTARATAEHALLEARRAIPALEATLRDADAELITAERGQTGFGRLVKRLGLGRVAELQRAATDTSDQLAWWHTEHARREAAWQEAVTGYDRVTGPDAASQARFTSALAQRGEECRFALQRYERAQQAFTDAIAAHRAGRPIDIVGATREQWIRLGHAIYDRIVAGIGDTGESDRRDGPGSWHRTDTWVRNLLSAVEWQIGQVASAASEREQRAAAHAEAELRRDGQVHRLQQARMWADAEIERFTGEYSDAQTAVDMYRVDLDALIARREQLAAELGEEDPTAMARRLDRRMHVLEHLPGLSARWRELTAERTDHQLIEDVQQSLIRATNLVCATTKGIVGRGSDLVRYTDFDTLIVDEASRVTESEFLIGAVRARKWVLVGDEYQLPPHVDQEDEHFLHALTALHRVERGASPSLDQAVDHLARVWSEDEELRKFRVESVQKKATDLDDSGKWRQTFQERFSEAHSRFAQGSEGDSDRALLAAMQRYLVQSLFKRAVARVRDTMREPLIWQRRMVAPLAEVVNKPIYGGRYRSPSPQELARAGVTPLVTSHVFTRPGIFVDTSRYQDAEDTPVGYGFVNERELKLITKICELYNQELSDQRAEPVTVSVLAFYRAQANRLEAALQSRDLPMLNWQVIDVIDRIQGQQSELVVISFTRARRRGISPDYGPWLQDVRRLNVACTRARRALVLVGHGDTLHRLGAGSKEPHAKQARSFYENLFGLIEDGTFQRKWRL